MFLKNIFLLFPDEISSTTLTAAEHDTRQSWGAAKLYRYIRDAFPDFPHAQIRFRTRCRLWNSVRWKGIPRRQCKETLNRDN